MKFTIPVKQGDNIIMQISGLGSSGEGVGKYEGFTVFVKGALPQEEVQVKITLVKKSYAVGRLLAILKQSPDRVEPVCPVYAACGGCQLQHLGYAGQLACKRQQVQDALYRIGHLELDVLPVLGAANPWNYRNKMQFPAAVNAEGALQIGCYATATHSVIDTDGCCIQKEANNEVLLTVRKWMQRFGISAYDEKTGKGLVRHVMGRVGVHSGEVMAVLITSAYDIPHRRELIEWLKNTFPVSGAWCKTSTKSLRISLWATRPVFFMVMLISKINWGRWPLIFRRSRFFRSIVSRPKSFIIRH